MSRSLPDEEQGGDSKAKGTACPKTEMKSPERMFPRRQKSSADLACWEVGKKARRVRGGKLGVQKNAKDFKHSADELEVCSLGGEEEAGVDQEL